MKAKCVVALIVRDVAEQLPVQIMAHELPLMKEMHGREVQLTDADPVVPEIEINPADEYYRLISKYGSNETGIPIVERIYGREADFVKELENIYSAETKSRRRVKDDESNVG